MDPQNKGHLPRKIGKLISTIYRRTREPVMYILVIVIITGPLWNPRVQRIAFGILLGIILRMQIEIQQAQEQIPLRHFDSLAHASAEIETTLRAALRTDGYIYLQWIAVTGFQAWTVIEPILDRIARQEHPRRVTVHFVLIDKNWLDCHKLNPAWTGASAEVIAERINLYPTSDPSKLEGTEWQCQVRRYAHMPQQHGGLINGKYLIEGTTRWENGVLRAANRPVDLYSASDGPVAIAKIEAFQSWFSFDFQDKPAWYVSDSIQPPQPPDSSANSQAA